ncbi:MAG: cellulase family glycosylhydrolase [Myxococcota bacterium]
MRTSCWTCALVTLALGCDPARETPPDPPAETAAFSVVTGALLDPLGRQVILRGANVSGMQKYPPYIDFHTEADFRRMRDEWAMNSARYLLSWAAVMPQRGVVDETYLARVKERMDWAAHAGILVILDMHQDVYGEGFGANGAPRWTCDESYYAAYTPDDDWYLNYLDPNVVACFDAFWADVALQQLYSDAWVAVARTLKDHPAVIGFDVINEPWLGSFAIDDFEPMALQPFYELVVGAIRAEEPDWVAFLEPSSMRNLGQTTRLAAFPFPNVVYSPHSYDAAAERGEGFDAERRAAVFSTVAELAEEARTLNAALWIGEYGGRESHPGITEYMDAELDAADLHRAGAMYWDYSRSDGYGLLDVDGAEKTTLLNAVVRPAPRLVDGTELQWAYDSETRTLTVQYRARGKATTEIVAPARVYPGGVAVECAQCSATTSGQDVHVEASEGAQVVITVRPAS